MSIYDYKFKDIYGKEVAIKDYKNKVILIINIASKCGFTPQLEDLEKIYKKYSNEEFEIIGFPCNQFASQAPGSNSDLNKFCKLNYGVTFKLSQKIDVRGTNSDPIFDYLTSKCPFEGFNKDNISDRMLYSFLGENFPEYLVGDTIKWNFTKFLIDRKGNPVKRFEPSIEPMDMLDDIKRAIKMNV
ncbi:MULTISPECIES: glutathione peroxidase [Clostridium]|uniref:glutathione peroxidase n=1 Tax=Clostridium TaxID=1485 RepID=UPI000824ECB4|nr:MULTISPECIES: glutathione peroxidase [Clostridium]PJI07585.1 glutathione peroxidase [Clostridium sp. CT7]